MSNDGKIHVTGKSLSLGRGDPPARGVRRACRIPHGGAESRVADGTVMEYHSSAQYERTLSRTGYDTGTVRSHRQDRHRNGWERRHRSGDRQGTCRIECLRRGGREERGQDRGRRAGATSARLGCVRRLSRRIRRGVDQGRRSRDGRPLRASRYSREQRRDDRPKPTRGLRGGGLGPRAGREPARGVSVLPRGVPAHGRSRGAGRSSTSAR